MSILVASMLPAVAAAHTMGYDHSFSNFWNKTAKPSVDIQPGPNYISAYNVGSIVWKEGGKSSYSSGYCPGGATSAGQIDLEGISNMTTTMLNVIEINLTNTGYNAIKPVSITVGIMGNFPNGSKFLVSGQLISLSDIHKNWKSFTAGSYNSFTFQFQLDHGKKSTTYLSFILPPSSQYAHSIGDIWYKVGA